MSVSVSNHKRRKALTDAQQLRQDIIAPLFKKGYSFREIRVEVMTRLDLATYSLRTVKKDIDALLAEWRSERIENIDQNIQLELERIDTLVKEAWEAWEKSKTDYEKKKSRQDAVPSPDGGGNGDGNEGVVVVAMSQTREEMTLCGDPRFIETINRLLSERRKLLGLYAPEKNINVGNTNVTVGKEMTIKEMEAEIARLSRLDNGKRC